VVFDAGQGLFKVQVGRYPVVVVDVRVVAEPNGDLVLRRHLVDVADNVVRRRAKRLGFPAIWQYVNPLQKAHFVTSRNNRMISSSACFSSASILSRGRGGVYL